MQKTLPATLSAIDVESLQQRASTRERPLRILDAARGTGLLLEQFTHLFPHAELYGIDESQAMLAQAVQLFQVRPHVHLVQASLEGGETAGLPYALASFDLITCTNAWHYLKDPAATLEGRLLVSGGQVVIEDYVLRGFPFPWKAFEWVIKYYDPSIFGSTRSPKPRRCVEASGSRWCSRSLSRLISFVRGGSFVPSLARFACLGNRKRSRSGSHLQPHANRSAPAAHVPQ